MSRSTRAMSTRSMPMPMTDMSGKCRRGDARRARASYVQRANPGGGRSPPTASSNARAGVASAQPQHAAPERTPHRRLAEDRPEREPAAVRPLEHLLDRAAPGPPANERGRLRVLLGRSTGIDIERLQRRHERSGELLQLRLERSPIGRAPREASLRKIGDRAVERRADARTVEG